MERMERKDVLLLAIAAAQEQKLTPVQLQKSLFLISRVKLPDLPEDFYPFYPYNYGPFHPAVYQDAEELVAQGLVAQLPNPGKTWGRYSATPAGMRAVELLEKRASPAFHAYVKDVVRWTTSLTFTQLLRAIYKLYPKFRANSVFQD